MMKTIEHEFFIPYNVPSLKNSKIKGANGIFHSKTVSNYLKALGIQSYSSSKKTVKGYVDKSKPNLFEKALISDKHNIDVYAYGCIDDNWGDLSFINCVYKATNILQVPLELGFHQVRNSKRRFDYFNSFEIISDLLVASGIIEDDNCDCLVPMPYQRNNQWYTVDKENCGVYLKILNKI